jgi:Xaa-Pro aminopeptidase
MVLAIEPMVNVGKPAVKVLTDGWTAVTRDGSLSAHFEHTVVVTADGCEILTLLESDAARAQELVGRATSPHRSDVAGAPGAGLPTRT